MKKDLYRNWWAYTVKSVFALAFGLIVLLVKEATDDWLVLLFGGFIVLSGSFLVIGAVSSVIHRKKLNPWLFEGLFDITLGILIVVYHILYADIGLFFFLVAVWAASVGLEQLIAAIRTNKGIKTRWLLWLNAISLITAAMILFFSPYETTGQTMNMIATVTIIFGVLISIYSFGLKEGY